MTLSYDFDQLANRSNDYSKKWDKEFVAGRYGKVPDDYISMWIADLDFELAPPIYERFKEIIELKSLGYTYTYDEFYDSIKNYLALKTPMIIERDAIMLDYSIVSSLYHAIQAFVSPAGRVLINSPVYNPFREASQRNKVSVVENELYIGADKRYQIDFEKLADQMVATEPDIYILCSPHNPGGRVWSKAELEKIATLCQKNDITLVVDEAHSDHINQADFVSILSLDEHYLKNVVYFNSPNKPFNLAGLKTSYVVISEPTLRNKYQRVLLENHIDEPNVFGVAGLIAAYTPEGLEWTKQSYQYMMRNYDWAKEYVTNYLPQLDLMPLDSTYVMWLKVTDSGMDGDDFTTKLAQATGVLVQEGSSFGMAGKDYVRINLGTSRANVETAFERIKNWLESLPVS